MKRIFQRRFSMIEAASLIAVLLLGIGLYSWAATTVTYTFTGGSTAIATQVNTNFRDLALAIDSVDASVTPDQIRAKYFQGACAGNSANDIMVKVGPLCVDKYEASVWGNPDGTGAPYGTGNPYPNEFPPNGNWTTVPVYAVSKTGVKPSTGITWFQAQQACALSGKRLLTNAEWQMAAAGTPDTIACNISGSVLGNTDANLACISNWGVINMVGNVSEWVADWIQSTNGGGSNWNPDSITSANSTDYGSDSVIGINEAIPTTDGFPGALIRGGSSNVGSGPGVFSLDASHGPSFPQADVGFRCAR